MSIVTQSVKVLSRQQWRHFKGNEYQIICTTETTPPPLDVAIIFSAVHTETEKIVDVCTADGKRFWLYCEGEFIEEPHTVYNKPSDEHPWARPTDNFLAILCNGKPCRQGEDYTGRTLYCRFELIGESTSEYDDGCDEA